MKSSLGFFLVVVALGGGLPLLPGFAPPALAADITGYTLINADTDLPIRALTPGAVLDLATLPTRHLNVRADSSPAAVGSVVFELSGPQAHAETENQVPYALFSDIAGDYFAWTPPVGSYVLLATPYAGPDGTGPAGTPLTLRFTVVNTVGSVASFTLVNADTDLDIGLLAPGQVLDLATLPTRHLNIRANTAPAAVGSVTFSLSGAGSQATTENVAPYALASDTQGDYDAWIPPTGPYSLTATPFSLAGGGGAAGTPLTLTFQVKDSNPLPVELTAFTATSRDAGQVVLRWSTASELNNDRFDVQRSADGQQFTTLGTVRGQGSSTVPHAYSYHDELLLASPTRCYYRLRQVDTNGTSTFSPVRTVLVAGAAPALRVFPTLAAEGVVHYAFAGPTAGGAALELLTGLGQRRGWFPLAAGGVGTVEISGLPPGTYLLRLVGANGRYSARFVRP